MTDSGSTVSAEDANKRAVEDYSQYSQYWRMAAQFSFAANGGAALAMLSFLTAITTAKELNKLVSIETVIRYFSFAAALYLLGVLLVTLALFLMSTAKHGGVIFGKQ